jgi:hypothetical protein
MQDLDQFRLSDSVIAIIGDVLSTSRPACANFETAWHSAAIGRKKARQPVLVAAPCLFLQLAHLDGNYP